MLKKIGKHIINDFTLNASDTKLTTKVIANRVTLTLKQLGKLVQEKEQARSLAKAIGVDVNTVRIYRRVESGAKIYGGCSCA